MYENVIKIFEDIIEDEVFHTYSFDNAYKQIVESKSNLKFLLGESGSGKSFLINYLQDKLSPTPIVINGFISTDEIDSILDEYRLIIIDEAQLLEEKVIEYIRILTDTKKYNFLLSMHKHESDKILQQEHFKSRDIEVILLDKITKEEMIQYLNIKLLQANANHLLTKKEFNKIYNYTNGNFRYIKKFIKTLFQLLQFAKDNNLKKYDKINNCLITMSAIELGLENG